MSETMTLEDVRAEAKQKLKGVCVVYRDCDGAASNFCQGQSYGRPLGIGGAGSGASFGNNSKALAARHLRMQVVGAPFDPDTSYRFLGRSLTMPVMAASVSGVDSFGGSEVITEGDFCQAVVDGSNQAGTLAWRGHSHNYSLETPYGIDAIAAGGRGGVKIVKPCSQDEIKAFFEKAEAAGATAVGIDVDGCGSYMMNKHHKPVFRKSPEDMAELAASTSLPLMIKGIMCAGDAVAAADAGAAGIVVSNHGGRVLDHTPGTAEVLPGIAAALAGRDVVLLADGGVRTGWDVLKMLALGADAVLIGRDLIRAAIGAGGLGVRLQMHCIQKQLNRAMLMTGCPAVGDITGEVLC